MLNLIITNEMQRELKLSAEASSLLMEALFPNYWTKLDNNQKSNLLDTLYLTYQLDAERGLYTIRPMIVKSKTTINYVRQWDTDGVSYPPPRRVSEHYEPRVDGKRDRHELTLNRGDVVYVRVNMMEARVDVELLDHLKSPYYSRTYTISLVQWNNIKNRFRELSGQWVRGSKSEALLGLAKNLERKSNNNGKEKQKQAAAESKTDGDSEGTPSS